MVEGGQDFALRQITGCAENDKVERLDRDYTGGHLEYPAVAQEFQGGAESGTQFL